MVEIDGSRDVSRSAAGAVLFVAGLSVVAGVLGVLLNQDLGDIADSVACGVVFLVLFFLAIALRWVAGLDVVRAALGVVSVLMLVACYGFAAQTRGSGAQFGDWDVSTKVAVGSGLFAAGMGVVAVMVPSAVASGLVLVGLDGAAAFGMLSAGTGREALVVAVLVALVGLVIAARVPVLRPHGQGLPWMLGVGAALAAGTATALAGDDAASSSAAAGVVGLALLGLAWRHGTVVPAIAAVPPLLATEAYAVARLAGQKGVASAASILGVGIVLVVVVAVTGVVVRRGWVRGGVGPARVEELLLVAAMGLALMSLFEPASGWFRVVHLVTGVR